MGLLKLFPETFRGKLFLGFLFPIVPMLAIVLISYFPAKHNTLETGWRLMELSTKSCSERLDTYFKAREDQFAGWTEIDVFGLAIEFNTLKELKDHLSSLLVNNSDFLCLSLTDANGKVMAEAVNPRSSSLNFASLIDRQVIDTSSLENKGPFEISLVETTPIFGEQLKNSHTLLYCFTTRDSSGNVNGYFLAWLDWAYIKTMMDTITREMIQNGFESSRIALVETRKKQTISVSDDQMIRALSLIKHWKQSISFDVKDSIHTVMTERGAEFTLTSPVNFVSGKSPDHHGTNYDDSYLAVFVTEKDMLSRVRRIAITAIVIAAAGGLTFLLICLFLSRSITFPMRQLAQVLEDYASGNMNIRARIESKDEIGFFARRFNAMLEQINDSARTLQTSESKYRYLFTHLQDAINEKNYQFRFESESEDDDLSLSLNTMLSKLEAADIQAVNQDWLKSGQADLSDAISGERKIDSLCRTGLEFIANYVGANVGTFYVKEPDGEAYELAAHVAFKKSRHVIYRFEPGEGIVGQAALEKNKILITHLPKDYIQIESSLGKALPDTLLVFPLIFEGNVLGIIELATFDSFSQLQLDFIELAGNALAVAINAALFNRKLETLLDQTQLQSEVLQRQKTELKKTNEELGDQAAVLEEQAAVLKESELKLQASNEELEDKTQLLEKQKKEIEKTNASLRQKQLEVEEKARQLELATQYKSEFLANMSHELRTPLNSMLLLAKMLSDNEENTLNPDQVESAQSIHRSGQKLLRLINDILDLSKIEANRVELSIAPASLEKIAEDLKTEFDPLAKDKGLEFDVALSRHLPLQIQTDEYRLEQILRNLIGNALKFTETGGVALRVSRPSSDVIFEKDPILNKGPLVAFSVTDTGPGISQDHLDLIFDAFKQVDGSISRRYGGTGLGLSISRNLANLIKGEIRAQSTPGKGSIFTLYLPEVYPSERTVDRTLKSKLPEQSIPVAKPGKPLKVFKEKKISQAVFDDTENSDEKKRKKILIIEDDATFAGILRRFFNKQGYTAELASDGESGIAAIIENQPAAVILDIRLPGINGWAILDELKNNPATRHIPVHIMSAFDDTSQGLGKGAVGYLTKPVTDEELTAVLERIENIITRSVKHLLIVVKESKIQESLKGLLESNDIHCTVAGTGSKALELMRHSRFDCIILDPWLPDISGFEVLETIRNSHDIERPPIILYGEKALSLEEKEALTRYSSSLAVKCAVSMERLLDETALFLHRVESRIPDDQRKMIQKIRDRESVLAGRKILVVDDDMRNAFALRKFLKTRGMEVLIANNGKKAIELLEAGVRPDIVLMDIMMPVMDGYETMVLIRKQAEFKNLPILALTAKAMASDKERCIRCGANDYLTKPVDTAKLLTMLRVWLYS